MTATDADGQSDTAVVTIWLVEDNEIFGCVGNTLLPGGDGIGFIQSGDGNDTIRGYAGVDTIYGGLGDANIGGSAECAVLQRAVPSRRNGCQLAGHGPAAYVRRRDRETGLQAKAAVGRWILFCNHQ